MRLNCPACGAAMSLDALLAGEGAREAVMTALQLPAPLGKALVQYLALFRPLLRHGSGQARRQLSFDRVNSLLAELLPLIQSGKFERNGRLWAAPVESWRQGIEEMLAKRDSLTLPLKSHGYLLTILAGYADKTEARAEAQAEERQRSGRAPVGAASAANPANNEPACGEPVESVEGPGKKMPAAIRAQLEQFIHKTAGGENDR